MRGPGTLEENERLLSRAARAASSASEKHPAPGHQRAYPQLMQAVIPSALVRRRSSSFLSRGCLAILSVGAAGLFLFYFHASRPSSADPSGAGALGKERASLTRTHSKTNDPSRITSSGSGRPGDQSILPSSKARNVVFILLDDVGMNDLGRRSSDLHTVTPFMEALSREGVWLSRYYTNHFCTPARASLMTGRDTFLTGMQFRELADAEPWGLPLDEVTLAERFKAAGYATHMAGKWNLGMFSKAYYPFSRGFDSFLGYLGPFETYYEHEISSTYRDFGYGDMDGYINSTTNTTRQGPEYNGVYSTTATADRAIEIVRKQWANGTGDPIFLYLAFQAVHTPLDTPREDMFTTEELETLLALGTTDAKRKKFAKILYYLDITLEHMFEALDEIGFLDDTLIIIASDNGGCPSAGGDNYPFRGFKWTQFEGGVRAPAFVWSKSDAIVPLEARGTTYDDPMHVVDWTQTLANVTGIPTAEMGKPLTGYDHWAAILGQRPVSAPSVRGEVVLGRSSYEYNETIGEFRRLDTPRGAYIKDGWKVLHGDREAGWCDFDGNGTDAWGWQCEEINCTYKPAENKTYLFDLENDPFEKVDLSDIMSDKVYEMLDDWNRACIDEILPVFQDMDEGAAHKVWKEYNDWVVAWR